jgi:hypothetical protein
MTEHGPKHGEMDVTCTVWDREGNHQTVSGVIKDLGCALSGFELDPEAEFEYEYERPEAEVTLFGFQGIVTRVRAWLGTIDGPQVVLESKLEEPIRVLADESLTVVGQALRNIG